MTEREIEAVLRAVPRICGHCGFRGFNDGQTRCSNDGSHTDWQPDYTAMARAIVERVVGERRGIFRALHETVAMLAKKHGIPEPPPNEYPCIRLSELVKAVAADRDARLARLVEALRKTGERLHGLSDDPECMDHIFADCPRYTCSEVRAALADAAAGKER